MQIPQSNIRNMLKAISAGNHVFNETVTMYRNTKSDCPTCAYDPVRKESTDSYCVTCSGVGFLMTEVPIIIQASVETSEDFKYEFTRAGIFIKGNVYLTIDILEINTVLNVGNLFNLDTYQGIKNFLDSFDYVRWQNAKFIIGDFDFQPGYLQGNLYEIGCTLMLSE